MSQTDQTIILLSYKCTACSDWFEWNFKVFGQCVVQVIITNYKLNWNVI